jgi:putative transposase
MTATMFIEQHYPVSKVLRFVGLSASSYYYQPLQTQPSTRGIKPSEYTRTVSGAWVHNDDVVAALSALLKMEFVDYGYLKCTYHLRDELGYLINHKKVFRLMRDNQLLYRAKKHRVGNKTWVSKLVPEPTTAFSYWEFDIKFMYIHGTGKMVPLLTVIDVYSRWVLGHMFQESIKKEDVKAFFKEIADAYVAPQKVHVRCDNGSQFESALVREYFASVGIVQEFTKPATPEQNAHIESYHSVLERVICQGYEFEQTSDCFNTLKRWLSFYNYKRIHSGTGYQSPYKNLMKEGINVNELFSLNKPTSSNIFIPLSKTEASSAEEQLARDSIAG